MKRATTTILGAVIGTIALVGLKTQPGGLQSSDVVATAPVEPGQPTSSGPGRADGSPAPASSGPAKTTATRTVNGSRERAGKYGYVQVQIVMQGNRMTAIKMLEVTSRLNSAARSAPAKLIPQALAAQSAKIGNVSRATYTSDAFKASLRTALAKA